MSSKRLTLAWPPIIYSKSIPAWIRIRDTIITLLAWALMIFILHDFWTLIYDYFSDPIFELLEDQSPDWAEVWRRISQFVYIAAGLIVWIISIGLLRIKSIQRTGFNHTPLLEFDNQKIALEFGFSLTQIEEWHTLRAVNVYVNDQSVIEKIEISDAV